MYCNTIILVKCCVWLETTATPACQHWREEMASFVAGKNDFINTIISRTIITVLVSSKSQWEWESSTASMHLQRLCRTSVVCHWPNCYCTAIVSMVTRHPWEAINTVGCSLAVRALPPARPVYFANVNMSGRLTFFSVIWHFLKVYVLPLEGVVLHARPRSKYATPSKKYCALTYLFMEVYPCCCSCCSISVVVMWRITLSDSINNNMSPL